MEQLGRIVVLMGIILVAVGVILIVFHRIPLVGKLPGDIHVRRDNFEFYLPITTSILLSVLISLVLWIVALFQKR
jgi:hypothetical protein